MSPKSSSGAAGLGVAIVAGWVIGRLKLEGWLEPWVLAIQAGRAELPETAVTWPDRIRAGLDAVREIVGHVWYWIIAGIAAGALIHGYVPALAVSAGRHARHAAAGRTARDTCGADRRGGPAHHGLGL